MAKSKARRKAAGEKAAATKRNNRADLAARAAKAHPIGPFARCVGRDVLAKRSDTFMCIKGPKTLSLYVTDASKRHVTLYPSGRKKDRPFVAKIEPIRGGDVFEARFFSEKGISYTIQGDKIPEFWNTWTAMLDLAYPDNPTAPHLP